MREGWMGESKGDRDHGDDIEVLDLHDVASSWQFREAQEEDGELQEPRAIAMDALEHPQASTTAASP